MKKLLLVLILITMQFNIAYSISQEPHCYAASDFLVFKSQDLDPELIALYDDTTVYFDVNNDGIWEYQKILKQYQKYSADTNWKLEDGSYIHSDKPIIYNQRFYLSSTSSIFSENIQCIPPINALSKEIVLYPLWKGNPEWKIISPNATLNLVNPNNELSIRNIAINTTVEVPRTTSEKNIWYINSTKPLIAVSPYSLSSKLDNDFIKVIDGKALIVAIEDNTQISYDKNSDGIFDDSETINRGYREIELITGTRIRSNKKIGVFESTSINDRDFSQSVPTRSVNDELYISIYQPGKTFISGIFNDDTGFKNMTYKIHDEHNGIIEQLPSNSAVPIPMSVRSNAARINAEKPVLAFYSNYPLNNYRFQRPMQTIEPYITSFSRKKFLGLNDTAIINVRALNPTSYDLENVKVTIRYTDAFSNPNIKYYISTKLLEDDSFIVSTSERTVTPLDYGNVREFTINIGPIASEEYVNIDYYLTTPETIGTYLFPSASMQYNSMIWNYD